MASSVRTEIDRSGLIQKVEFYDAAHRPSWQNHGSGTAGIKFSTHKNRKYLSLTAFEYSSSSDRRREVMISLDEKDAAELMRQLNEIMKPAPVTEEVSS